MQVVDTAADKFGDREGLVVTHQAVRRTFSQIREEVDRCSVVTSAVKRSIGSTTVFHNHGEGPY